MALLWIIVGGALVVEALKEYNAEKHAQKMVYNQDVSFIDFMLTKHPLMFGLVVLFIVLFFISLL